MKTRGILSWRRGIFSRCISLGFVRGPTGSSQGGAEAADTEATEQSHLGHGSDLRSGFPFPRLSWPQFRS